MYAPVNLSIIGSDNGLVPDRHQAIIWTNAGILLIGPSGINFSEIWMIIPKFSFMKMHMKVASAKMAAILSRRRWVKKRLAPAKAAASDAMKKQVSTQAMHAGRYFMKGTNLFRGNGESKTTHKKADTKHPWKPCQIAHRMRFWPYATHPHGDLMWFVVSRDYFTLTEWDLNKMATISQTTFSNAFSWMKKFGFWLQFHWNVFLRIQLTITQH